MPELSPLRELNTTASQAPIIINGSADKLYELWQERVGEIPPKDFSDNIAVQRGIHDEPFILRWLNKRGRLLTEHGTFLKHPTLPNISCTLDAYDAMNDAVIEAKCQSAFRKLEDVLAWYTPQVLVQMRCRGAARGILAVLQDDLHELEVLIDEDYERQVWERLAAFQLCCELMTPPAKLPELVPPELWRTVDLGTDNPNWGPDMRHCMRMWADTKEDHAIHENMKKSIKSLVPDDVGTVLFGRLSVKRAKNNAITIREGT